MAEMLVVAEKSLAELMCMLPADVLELIIAMHLSLDELGRLDIALCTRHPIRGLYLQVLRSVAMQVSVERNEFWNKRLDKGILSWIVARGIRIVSLKNSTIDNEGVIAVANSNPPDLRLFDIDHCWIITDSGVTALANGNLVNLQSLNIGGCDEITDSGVTALANGKISNLQSFIEYWWMR